MHDKMRKRPCVKVTDMTAWSARLVLYFLSMEYTTLPSQACGKIMDDCRSKMALISHACHRGNVKYLNRRGGGWGGVQHLLWGNEKWMQWYFSSVKLTCRECKCWHTEISVTSVRWSRQQTVKHSLYFIHFAWCLLILVFRWCLMDVWSQFSLQNRIFFLSIQFKYLNII